jgi:hypothetical protein
VVANGFVIAGLACIVAGVWLVYPPAAVVLLGVACIIIGIGVLRDDR